MTSLYHNNSSIIFLLFFCKSQIILTKCACLVVKWIFQNHDDIVILLKLLSIAFTKSRWFIVIQPNSLRIQTHLNSAGCLGLGCHITILHNNSYKPWKMIIIGYESWRLYLILVALKQLWKKAGFTQLISNS